MRQSLFSDLWTKAFRTESPLNLFIAINILIFLIINLLKLPFVLGFSATDTSKLLISVLQIPSSLTELTYKPWTIISYMFTQQGFFHLLFNLLWLYWLGIIFLDFLKNRQFVFVYLMGGIAGAIIYLLIINIAPAFQMRPMEGASAGVSAIIFATSTLIPNYSIRMLLFGNVKLKYLALAFIVLDILAIGSLNTGGSIAHIGGAIFGILYIKQLQKGSDWSSLFTAKPKRKIRVIRNNSRPVDQEKENNTPNQEIIDQILDKISHSGYESLTKAEKETLFKASKQDQN